VQHPLLLEHVYVLPNRTEFPLATLFQHRHLSLALALYFTKYFTKYS
jgi:hypothetical protein